MHDLAEALIDGIIHREGREYSDRAADLGGPTKFGITQRTLSDYLRRPASAADVQALDEPTARLIYRYKYVVQPGFAAVLDQSQEIGEEVIDSGVNCGVARAATWLQRCLNALNRQQTDYPDVPADGDCGPATILALQAYMRKRGVPGVAVMLRALNGLQAAHYIALAEGRGDQEQNLYGWLLNRVA